MNIIDDVIQFVMANKEDVLKVCAFLVINKWCIQSILERKALVKISNQIRTKKVVSIDEALLNSKKREQSLINQSNKSKKLKQQLLNQTYLIKVQPLSIERNIQVIKDLRSNQLWYIQPSLNGIAQQISKIYNKAFIENTYDYKILLQKNPKDYYFNQQWYVKTANNKLKIQGFGRIVDDQVFDVQAHYKFDKKKGFFKSIYQNLAYLLQWVFFLKYTKHDKFQIRLLSENPRRKSFIQGPIIGKMKYLFNFLTNRYILINAKIQNGQVFPLVISSSRGKILDYFNQQIFHLNTKIFLCLISSLYVYRTFHKFAKKKFKQLKEYIKTQMLIPGLQQKLFKIPFKFESSSQKLTEDKMCIICYTNCRNLILFNCRHVIMCQECKQAYKHQTCPLCKEEIEDQKVFYQA